jgi:signal peptidase II
VRPIPAGRRVLAIVAGGVIAADQLSKAIAVRELAGRGVVPVLGGSLHLELYRNFAGSGNRFTGHPLLVSLLALVAIVLLAGFARRVRTRGAALAAGLLLGGGISNLLDRLLRAPGPLRGGVVDWLKPTASGGSMNLADLAITLGVAVIVGGAIVGTLRARPTRGEAV